MRSGTRGWIGMAGLATVLAGCPPPPAVGGGPDGLGSPTIKMLSPLPSNLDPDATNELRLDADGALRLLVVVDIDNLILIEPNTSEVAENEGHFHILIDPGEVYLPTSQQFFEFDSSTLSGVNLQPDGEAQTHVLTVELVNNVHQPLGCDTCLQTYEFQLLPAEEPADTDGG